jgi:hypothetical protein
VWLGAMGFAKNTIRCGGEWAEFPRQLRICTLRAERLANRQGNPVRQSAKIAPADNDQQKLSTGFRAKVEKKGGLQNPDGHP